MTYSLRTAQDLRAKLQRDITALEGSVNGDRLFNVVVTGHHLVEWIRKDASVDGPVRARLDEVHRSQTIGVCADLANATKHFVHTPKRHVRSAESSEGFGIGRFGKGEFGVGEESIQITFGDGTEVDCLEFCHRLSALYEYVFNGGTTPSEIGVSATA